MVVQYARRLKGAIPVNKVQGGTPHSGVHLCSTCRHSHILKSESMKEIHMCRIYGDRLPIREPIYYCTEYDDKRLPSREDMNKIAWTIESRVRGPMGFADGKGKDKDDKGETGDREVTISPPRKPVPWEE